MTTKFSAFINGIKKSISNLLIFENLKKISSGDSIYNISELNS